MNKTTIETLTELIIDRINNQHKDSRTLKQLIKNEILIAVEFTNKYK